MRCAVFGSGGGIGGAIVDDLLTRHAGATIYAGSRAEQDDTDPRVRPFQYDLGDEQTIAQAAREIGDEGPLDLVVVATGILQDEPDVRPEKTWAAIDADAMAKVFAINTIGPALIGKHFLPLLNAEGSARCAFLSARVGSIGDNGLGGWHSYRASKAALNMLVRNFAIELRRTNRGAVVAALHPGTVDTGLSQPFQRNVPAGKLFTRERAARQLLEVIEGLGRDDSGGFFAWDGSPIPW